MEGRIRGPIRGRNRLLGNLLGGEYACALNRVGKTPRAMGGEVAFSGPFEKVVQFVTVVVPCLAGGG